jgi:hypothetical protein
MRQGGAIMPALFEKAGVRFQYPDNWQMTQEATETGWTVSVQSPDTGFFLLTLDEEMPETGLMAETALDALRSEYPGLEAEDALDSLAGQPAVGHNIRFFSLDLTNTCCTRSFDSEGGTIFIMWQANDLELEELEPIFRAICASLEVEK